MVGGQVVGYIWLINESHYQNWWSVLGAIIFLAAVSFQTIPFVKNKTIKVLILLGPSLNNITSLALAYAMVICIIITLISLGLIGFSQKGTQALITSTPWNIISSSSVLLLLSFTGFFRLMRHAQPRFR